MNIAAIMIPKVLTVFLHETDTIRQGLERFTVHGYTAVPVLNEQEQYIGECDGGRFPPSPPEDSHNGTENAGTVQVADIVRRDYCPPLPMDAELEQVVSAALNQNYVPIVDSRKALCGILTRRGLIDYLAKKRKEA